LPDTRTFLLALAVYNFLSISYIYIPLGYFCLASTLLRQELKVVPDAHLSARHQGSSNRPFSDQALDPQNTSLRPSPPALLAPT